MKTKDISTLKEFIKMYPNDQDLGSTIRSSSHNIESDFVKEFIKMFPNDMELGNELRKKILSHIK
jgi:hypothetical protein